MATKVLMFGWEFPPHNSGGLGVACLGLTRALAREGFDITFVLPKMVPISSGHVKIKFADISNVRFKSINSPLSPYLTSGKYGKLFGGGSGLYGPNLISEVKRYALLGGALVLEDEYDVIYAHDWLSFGAGLEAKRISGKPLIVHVHATEFDRCGGASGINNEVYELERVGMEDADCVIAVSQFTKDTITRYYGIPAEKVIVVHNGVDDATFPYREMKSTRLGALKKAGYKIVLFAGRITLQKGPDYFIRAAKRVLEYNPKVIFLVVGSGDMERQVMQEAAYYKIADKVLFTGFLRGDDLAESYDIADLYVMPSVSEPFGITPLESMRVGTPVIISKQSGVSEVVHHALKVDFWDTEEMANKILSV
ncbi:MAG: glycosyltransferase family 4 protein, partial [bacterium]|nr:glycosyltransferase family 4 protein [bacterium]